MSTHVTYVAHRGDPVRHCDNTMAAFQAALDYRGGTNLISGIELDIQFTADNRIVVFHDPDLTRNCGCDAVVRQSDYETLRRISTASENMGHQAIPLLTELLTLVDHRKQLLIEIKDYEYDHPAFIAGLVAILEKYRPRGDVILHSFSAEIMEQVIEATKHMGVQFGLLFSKMESLEAAPPEMLAGLDYLHPQFRCLLDNEDTIAAYDVRLNTWTVNTQEDIDELLEMNSVDRLDNIITDRLDLIGAE